jgi:hypothetical protein
VATTGNVFAGTGENNAGIGATAWTSPGNITSDNATDASCNAGASSQYLVARNFSFSIPAGATILGVTVRIEGTESSSGTEAMNAQLQDESGTLVGSVKQATFSGTGATVYTYGGVNDTWGVGQLTPGQVANANFGVRFWFTTAHNITVDYVTMAIEFQVNSWMHRPRHVVRKRLMRAERKRSLL